MFLYCSFLLIWLQNKFTAINKRVDKHKHVLYFGDFGQYKRYPFYLKDQLLGGKMLVEVVALAHGVHFLHLLTLVLPTVSCGSYPGLSGSPVIPKPLSRDPSQGKNKCCFRNFLLKDDQPCRQVCLVHRHNLLVLRGAFTEIKGAAASLQINIKRWSALPSGLPCAPCPCPGSPCAPTQSPCPPALGRLHQHFRTSGCPRNHGWRWDENIFHENLRIMTLYWLHDTFYQAGRW